MFVEKMDVDDVKDEDHTHDIPASADSKTLRKVGKLLCL